MKSISRRRNPFLISLIQQSLILGLILVSTHVSAQTSFDEFKAWKQQTKSEFSDYKSKQDKAFASFLKQRWVELNAFKGTPLYEKKKIKTPPTAPKQVSVPKAAIEKPIISTPIKTPTGKKPEEPIRTDEPQDIIANISPPQPIVRPSVKHIPKLAKQSRHISFNYFGNTVAIPYDKAMKKRMGRKINKTTISEQWSVLAKSDFEPTLDQLNLYKKDLQLNDWAYAILVNQLAAELYPGKTNEQALFNWFVLIKSGYKSRLAYKKRHIYLLLATKQQIYAAQSLKYDGDKYYLLNFSGGKQERKLSKVYTYDGNYPAALNTFDMKLTQPVVTGPIKDKDKIKQSYHFSYLDNQYKFKTEIDKYLIEFMRTYPQAHWKTYFNSNPSTLPRQQIANQLRPLLQGLSEQEAINLLLRFVQTSLKYATDDEQFGFENPLFPEESLFYPASDCEDRSFLFAWLVKTLLNMEVIGLHYPGHMATAVKFRTKMTGDSVKYNGQKYIVADPTYINANVGNAMPQFKKSKVEIVPIDS